MRLFALSFLLCAAMPCLGQVPDPGTAGQYPPAEGPYSGAGNGGSAYGPGAAQDAEAAREKLLKEADQVDMLESNSEANKAALDGMKSDIAQLQADNTALKQQLAMLQAQSAAVQSALDREEAEHKKERQALIDEVSDLLASRSAGASTKPARHHHDDAESDTASEESSTEVHGDHLASSAAEEEPDHVVVPPDHAGPESLSPPPDTPPAPKPRKGYYHVVAEGETLSMICSAYRDEGVKVTVKQVMKANGLSSSSMLKVGQRLFIPKPGT